MRVEFRRPLATPAPGSAETGGILTHNSQGPCPTPIPPLAWSCATFRRRRAEARRRRAGARMLVRPMVMVLEGGDVATVEIRCPTVNASWIHIVLSHH